MRKPREFWIENAPLKSVHGVTCYEVTEVPKDSSFYIHVREVIPNNNIKDNSLESAIKIIKKGAGFGIIECQEWLEKWGTNETNLFD